MKTYHVYHEESRQTQSKLERVQSERVRVEQESKKSLPSKRVQRYEKQTEKVFMFLVSFCDRFVLCLLVLFSIVMFGVHVESYIFCNIRLGVSLVHMYYGACG